jgi:hypothetical protein
MQSLQYPRATAHLILAKPVVECGVRVAWGGVMKWMRERDLLIAQTMAFVQSVTGRKPDAEQKFADVPPVTATRLPDIEAMLAEALEIPASPPTAAPQPIVPHIVLPEAEIRQGQLPPALPGGRSAYQNEIQARVNNFRAHQQRFRKEREDYCSATMAKVHATLERFPAPPRINK